MFVTWPNAIPAASAMSVAFSSAACTASLSTVSSMSKSRRLFSAEMLPPVTRFSTELEADCWMKRVTSLAPTLNDCQLMMAPGLLVTLIGAVSARGEPDEDLITISRGDSEVWRGIENVIVVHDQHEVNRQRLVLQGNRLVGAIVIGDQTFSPIVSRLVREGVDIGPYLPALQAPHAHLAEILPQIAREQLAGDLGGPDLRPAEERL